MNRQQTRKHFWILFAAGVLCFALAVTMSAQVKTTTTEQRGPATHQVIVERGEVVYVQGNDLLIRMESGEMRHFPNVPDTKTVTVDGKELTIHDLQPGMKLQRTTITSTTPKTVTTLRTVRGTVWHVTPPLSVILTLENGTNQKFNIPKGQKFTVDGQETDAWGLKKGMRVYATAIKEVPETEISEEVRRTGTLPTPEAGTPLLVEAAPPVTAAAEPAPTTLPKTGTFLPLIGLLGVIFTTVPLGLKAIRALSS